MFTPPKSSDKTVLSRLILVRTRPKKCMLICREVDGRRSCLDELDCKEDEMWRNQFGRTESDKYLCSSDNARQGN